MTTDAEFPGMLPRFRECQEPPEAGRRKKDLPLEASDGTWSHQRLDFGLEACRL